MSQEQNNNNNNNDNNDNDKQPEQQQQEQEQQKTPADNFIDALNRLAQGEQRENFRSANFKLMQEYPTVFQKLWSNDQNEAVEAVQWIKNRRDELAREAGIDVELI